jgi:hypothetical protein
MDMRNEKMINFDNISKKRIAIAYFILVLPILVYSFIAQSIPANTLFGIILKICKIVVGFFLIVGFGAGIISAIFIVLYFVVILLARLLLGKSAIEKSEDSLFGMLGFGYVAIGIALAGTYYLVFSGLIKV